MYFLGVLFLLGIIVVPVMILVGMRSQLVRLEKRLEALERRLAPPGPAADALPAPEAPAAARVAVATPSATRGFVAPVPAPPARVAPAPGPHAPGEHAGMEQLIGGVWLQNLGAVLVLLGIFLMIVWGYSTGRFGPGVLVIAGVVLGLAFAWRGEIVSRTVRPFGHALIGTGLGIVYLTFYLGFVRLHVLGAAAALALLSLVSLGSILMGLRHRVQLIASLGVVGAFLPQFMAAWLGMGGFQLAPWELFGYIAIVDLLVFALTARAGWSALDMAAVVLGALAWVSAFHHIEWGWGVQLALAALYTLLGLAPLPMLARAEGRLRPMDLAVVAVSPLALLMVSAPFFAWADANRVAMLLFSLAAVQLVAALWLDRVRPERDAWVALTGAATIFFTAALTRALAPGSAYLAWCFEGVLLLALGLQPRAGSLRFWGSLLLFVGGLVSLSLYLVRGAVPGTAPVMHADSLRMLGATLSLLIASAILAQSRSRLTTVERVLPEIWAGIGNAMLMTWTGVEAGLAARAFVYPRPGEDSLPPPVGTSIAERAGTLATSLRGLLWMSQATVLAWRGAAAGRGFMRVCAYLAGAIALLVMGLWPSPCEGWYDQLPVLHPTALAQLAALVLAFAIAARMAAVRGQLRPMDAAAAEFATVLAGLGLLVWNGREAHHLARAILGMVPGALAPAAPDAPQRVDALAATLTSAAWLLEAIGLLVTGWLRRSAFLRWCGLAALGLTLAKFILVDMRSMDVFWRFLTAIAVGVAMLALSYAYQRRRRPAS